MIFGVQKPINCTDNDRISIKGKKWLELKSLQRRQYRKPTQRHLKTRQRNTTTQMIATRTRRNTEITAREIK